MLKSIAPRNVPAWLTKGFAMYFEGTTAPERSRRSRRRASSYRLAALRTTFIGLDATQAAVAYEESAFATHALSSDRLARSRTLLQDLDAGQTIEQCVERFGFTFAGFEAELAGRTGVAAPPPRRKQAAPYQSSSSGR